jgi:hypothetical protein
MNPSADYCFFNPRMRISRIPQSPLASTWNRSPSAERFRHFFLLFMYVLKVSELPSLTIFYCGTRRQTLFYVHTEYGVRVRSLILSGLNG